MISVEYKTDLGPDIAKDLNEIYCCLNTIYSSRSCQQTRRNSANRVRQRGRRDKIVPIDSKMKISPSLWHERDTHPGGVCFLNHCGRLAAYRRHMGSIRERCQSTAGCRLNVWNPLVVILSLAAPGSYAIFSPAPPKR